MNWERGILSGIIALLLMLATGSIFGMIAGLLILLLIPEKEERKQVKNRQAFR